MKPHPCGVLPFGAALLRASPVADARSPGLGAFAALPDELLLSVLGELSPKCLAALSTASRVFFAFATHEELWRAAALADFCGDVVFKHGWRATYFARRRGLQAAEPPPLRSVAAPNLFSDLLFAPHLACASPLQPEWLVRENVPRVSRLAPAAFRERFERPNTPVILTDEVTSWPAFGLWDAPWLERELGGTAVHAGGYSFALRDYLRYAANVTADDSPMYLFDSAVLSSTRLGGDYSTPSCFEEDLFGVLGSDRPDHAWLIAGPPRSGSSFHVDPNGTSAWNGVVRGSKRWVLFPPGVPPPGVASSPDGAHVAAPTCLFDWFRCFHSSASSFKSIRECTLSAGEVLFVPSGWWHAALNVGNGLTVAVTRNFASSSNLHAVLSCLRAGGGLVSGVPDDRRSGLHDAFVDALVSAGESVVDPQHPALAAALRRRRGAPLHDGAAKRAVVEAGHFAFGFAAPAGEE